MIETLGALAVTSLLVLGLTSMVDSSMEDLRGQQAAFHQAQVVRAADRYIKANFQNLLAQTPGNQVRPVTVQDLIDQRFLPAQFSATNNFNQNVCVLVRQPDNGQLSALVVTYGGERIPDRYLPQVALQTGDGGGYISNANWQNARGASWNLATTPYRNVACNGTNALTGLSPNDGGQLASHLFYDGTDPQGGDFLYRNAVAGRPELNRMNTAIRFGAGAEVAANSDCRVNGAPVSGIAIDQSTKQFLFCSAAGKWTTTGGSEWKESVPNHAQLLETPGTPGDVRLVRNIGRAFAYRGNAWVPLAADEENNLTVKNLNATGTIHAADHISTDKDVNIGKNLRVTGKVYDTLRVDLDVEVKRNLIADGVVAETWMYASGVSIGSDMVPGGVCNYWNGQAYAYPEGTVVTDKQGLVMSCYRVPGTQTYYFDYPRSFGYR